MKIFKFEHSCMLIEEAGIRFLFDPGSYSSETVEIVPLPDVILITDEHGDHYQPASIKRFCGRNHNLRILTQNAVHKLLVQEGISSEVVGNGDRIEMKGVSVEGFGEKHALMHSSIPQTDNTGYVIAERFFYPGDAFTNPGKPVEILALPIAGPWLKISEAVDYALEIKPKICFPVHDGPATASSYRIPSLTLPKYGIQFIDSPKEMEF